MIVNNILRYLFGYVKFRAVNGFGERLINLCASNNISLNNLVKTEEGFEAVTLKYDYKKVEEFAKKVNVETYVIKNSGVPFKVRKYKKRWGILAGSILFIAFIIISQNYIWQIEVKGNSKLSTETILYELEELGIKKWSFIPDIDFREKKQQALLKLPELSWLSINVSGCKINVLVSERYAPPRINENEPCDIVASKTGQIKYMEVYNGVKLIDLNYTVNAGDVIVSGTFTNKAGESIYVHSEAKIIAEVQFEKTLEIDISQFSKEYTGKVKKRHYIDFLSTKIPLFISTKMDGNYDIKEEVNYLNIFSNEIPIGIYTKEYVFYDKKNNSLSQSDAEQILKDNFNKYEKLELNDCAIINRDIKTIVDDGILRMTIGYTVEENIAKEAPLTNINGNNNVAK